MGTGTKSAFSLLNSAIQEQLYKMQWTQLRQIQVEAIHAILQSDDHLIITAMTAGGKTEAAFLPVLSSIVDDCNNGVRALYVGPLKALINDQFLRLEDLCKLSNIPVHKWHGDVSQTSKNELLKKPSGVLLITPESIESLFINRPTFLPSIFGQLSYIVIDETHAFIGTERGAHMKSLLSRLSKFNKNRIRIIALSATIGDVESAKKWLCPRETQQVRVIEGESDKSILYIIKGYLRKGVIERKAEGDESQSDMEVGIKATPDDIKLTEDIIRTFYGRTALIFANSRAKLEFYADLTRRTLETRNMPDRFSIHHGSLSKGEREDTEDALRSSKPTATFCSSTLELGIDVGNVSRVGQIGCPWTTSSLTQRLGRSGRKENESSEMWVYIEDDEPSEKFRLVDRLFPDLIQSIAMTELMLEKWCEPPNASRLHLSTLVQQIMSIIAERGGASTQVLYRDLIDKGSFVNVDKQTFLATLKSIGSADLIEQTPEGELILGMKGERIVRSYDFYSAFSAPEEMQVIHRGHRIGSITASPGISADTYLILAGKRWKIIEVDMDRKEILVESSKAGRLPYFASSSGADIHNCVRKKTKEILCSNYEPGYLDQKAKDMLCQAREVAESSGVGSQIFIDDKPNILWFTWTSSAINRTLALLGIHFAGLDVIDDDIALTFNKADADSIVCAYQNILSDVPTAEIVASKLKNKVCEKYDNYLSDDLLNIVYSQSYLDIPGAVESIRQIMDINKHL